MSLLTNKNILLGISGGIAAYKCAELTRRLKDLGANVRVVMTKGAKAFITPLTMQAVSGNPVSDSLLDPAAEAAMGHIELAKWADAVLIAPASADVIARLAQGMADDLLTTLCLATAAPKAIAPAMNQQMWQAPAVSRNISTLQQDGFSIFGPAQGNQACGDVGPGRMVEPHQLIQALQSLLVKPILAGKKLVITAGPTQEAIDPVRYLSNHSSGKMGYALANAGVALGAKVTLLSGPTALTTPYGVERIDIKSADALLQASQQACKDADIFIACAAVADYKIKDVADQKIKKSKDEMTIELIRNPDILATIANSTPRPFTVGFAAETQDVELYAKDKLKRKNLDMIAANNVAITGQGFGSDQNALTLYWQQGQHSLPLSDKQQLAIAMLEQVHQLYQQAGE